MEMGIVKFVTHTPKGFFGFLITSKGDLYFQEQDYQPFCIDVDKDIVTLWGVGSLERLPRVDDIIYFERQGTKADAWCTQSEGERVQSLMDFDKKFCVYRVKHIPSGKHKCIIWTGYDSVLMCYETDLILPIELNNGYKDGVYVTYEIV